MQASTLSEIFSRASFGLPEARPEYSRVWTPLWIRNLLSAPLEVLSPRQNITSVNRPTQTGSTEKKSSSKSDMESGGEENSFLDQGNSYVSYEDEKRSVSAEKSKNNFDEEGAEISSQKKVESQINEILSKLGITSSNNPSTNPNNLNPQNQSPQNPQNQFGQNPQTQNPNQNQVPFSPYQQAQINPNNLGNLQQNQGICNPRLSGYAECVNNLAENCAYQIYQNGNIPQICSTIPAQLIANKVEEIKRNQIQNERIAQNVYSTYTPNVLQSLANEGMVTPTPESIRESLENRIFIDDSVVEGYNSSKSIISMNQGNFTNFNGDCKKIDKRIFPKVEDNWFFTNASHFGLRANGLPDPTILPKYGGFTAMSNVAKKKNGSPINVKNKHTCIISLPREVLSCIYRNVDWSNRLDIGNLYNQIAGDRYEIVNLNNNRCAVVPLWELGPGHGEGLKHGFGTDLTWCTKFTLLQFPTQGSRNWNVKFRPVLEGKQGCEDYPNNKVVAPVSGAVRPESS